MNDIPEQKILHQCIDSFSLILVGDTQSIKIGENNLRMLSRHRNFVSILLAIPLKIKALGKIGINEPAVSKMSLLYCRTYLKYLQVENKGEVENCLGKMIEFLAIPSSNADKKMKNYISQIINDVLKSEKNKLLLTVYLQKLKIELANVEERLGLGVNINYEFLGLLTLTVIQAARKHKESIQFLQPTFQISLKLACQLVFVLQQHLLSKSEDSLVVIITLNLYTDVLAQYLQIFLNFEIDMRNQITNHSKILCQIFNQVFDIGVDGRKQGVLFAISWKGNLISINEELNHQILLLKSKAINILTLTSQLLIIPLSNSPDLSTILHVNNQYTKHLVKESVSMLKNKQHWELSGEQNTFLLHVLQYLQTLISSKLYFKVLFQLKSEILLGILMKTIMLSNQDYYQFEENPQEFVNGIYHIIDTEYKKLVNSSCEMDEQDSQKVERSEQNPESSDTLKTMSAKIYRKFTEQIDGSLSELTILCLGIIQSSTKQSYYKKDMILLLLTILQTNIGGQKDLVQRIFDILMVFLRFHLPPKKAESEEDQMGMREMSYQGNSQNDAPQTTQKAIIYCLALIATEAYLKYIDRYSEEVCQSLFGVIQDIVKNENIYQCIHIISSNLLSTIIKLYKLSENQTKNMMKMFLKGLASNKPSMKIINCLQLVVQVNLKEVLQPKLNILKERQDKNALEIFSILKQIQFTLLGIINSKIGDDITFNQESVFINKGWKILQDISLYLCYLQGFSAELFLSLSPFSNFFSIKYQQVVSEPLLRLFCILLKRETPFNDMYFQFIFKISKNFLNPEDSFLSLSTCFEFLQHFLYFTSKQAHSPTYFTAIKCMLEMSIYSIKEESANGLPRGQSEMCEGSLLIESIILNAGRFLERDVWVALMEVLYQRFAQQQKIVYDFFKASLATNMALIISYAHLCFQPNSLSLILDMLLKQHYCFTYKDSGKLFTSSIIQLLGQSNLPWVQNNYLKILDCSLTMLKLGQKKSDCLFEGQISDDEERYYENLQKKTMNPLKTVDQFRLFQIQVEKGREKNRVIVEKSCQALMENKKRIFQQIFRLRRVGKDVRVIYKIKGK